MFWPILCYGLPYIFITTLSVVQKNKHEQWWKSRKLLIDCILVAGQPSNRNIFPHYLSYKYLQLLWDHSMNAHTNVDLNFLIYIQYTLIHFCSLLRTKQSRCHITSYLTFFFKKYLTFNRVCLKKTILFQIIG